MRLEIRTDPPSEVIFGPADFGLLAARHRKVAVVTDRNLEKLYGGRWREELKKAGLPELLFAFEPGEAHKTPRTLEEIWDFLARSGLTRSDAVLAAGGGIVSDVAGFSAATFLRGVACYNLPTTLLAMVDAAVGGKTGVNLPQGKNLAGCFAQPRAVWADLSFLDTLPEGEWQNGLGEIVKYGCIASEALFERLSRPDWRKELSQIVFDCRCIKQEVVEADLLDVGLRQLLNFGHTLGHAIEKESDFTLPHGAAVGIGMVLITRFSEGKGLTEPGTAAKIEAMLSSFGMPTSFPESREKLFAAAASDKKRRGDRFTLALISRIGHGFLQEFDREELA